MYTIALLWQGKAWARLGNTHTHAALKTQFINQSRQSWPVYVREPCVAVFPSPCSLTACKSVPLNIKKASERETECDGEREGMLCCWPADFYRALLCRENLNSTVPLVFMNTCRSRAFFTARFRKPSLVHSLYLSHSLTPSLSHSSRTLALRACSVCIELKYRSIFNRPQRYFREGETESSPALLSARKPLALRFAIVWRACHTQRIDKP